MRYALLISIVLLSLPLRSQIIESFIERDTFDFCSAAAEFKGDIYLNRASNVYYQWAGNHQVVYRLNDSLQLLDSLDLGWINGNRWGEFILSYDISVIHDSTLWMTAVDYRLDSSNGYVDRVGQSYLLRLSESLTVLDTVVLGDSLNNVAITRLLEVNNKYLAIGGTWDSSFGNSSPLILELDLNGQVLSQSTLPSSLFSDIAFYMDLEWTGSVYVAHINQVFTGVGPRYAILDSKFQPIKMGLPSSNIIPNMHMLSYAKVVPTQNQTRYISTTQYYGSFPPPINSSDYYNLGVASFDLSWNLNQIDTFRFSGFNYDPLNLNNSHPAPSINAIQYERVDSVFIAVAGQDAYDISFPSHLENEIYLYNYNAELGVMNWSKVFKTGYTSSSMMVTEVLSNNRYLLVLNEYNWDQNPNEHTNLHVLIFDSLGNVLSEKEILSSSSAKSFVYPNPAANWIRFNPSIQSQSNSYVLQLHSLDGKLIWEIEVDREQTINIDGIQAGFYMLSIMDQSKLIHVQKIQIIE